MTLPNNISGRHNEITKRREEKQQQQQQQQMLCFIRIVEKYLDNLPTF